MLFVTVDFLKPNLCHMNLSHVRISPFLRCLRNERVICRIDD